MYIDEQNCKIFYIAPCFALKCGNHCGIESPWCHILWNMAGTVDFARTITTASGSKG